MHSETLNRLTWMAFPRQPLHPALCCIAAAACAALLTLYVASQRWNFLVQVPALTIEVMGGVLDIHQGGAPSWSVTRHNWPWRHAYAVQAGGGYWGLKLPLYVALVPTILVTAALWTGRGHSAPRRGVIRTGLTLPAGA